MEKEKIHEVIQLLIEHRGDYYRVARSANLTISEVEDIDVVHNKKYNYTKEGKGPDHLKKYIVAIRHVRNPEWPNNTKIVAARKQYDSGLVELTTGRDGMNLILYSIKRRFPVLNRKPWFYPLEDNVVSLNAR